VMGVALAHARSAAWSTAVPTVAASPGPGCGTCGGCDVAMFQVNAKITPTSTGPTVDASPVRPRVPRSPRGLDPRCTASPLGTKPERTIALRRRGPSHQKVISPLGHGPRQSGFEHGRYVMFPRGGGGEPGPRFPALPTRLT
jgi:hypothetical protein